MPGLVQRIQLDPYVVRKAQRDIDEDAHSDHTLDHDHLFGAPLERFDTYEDDAKPGFALEEEQVDALRLIQDEEWLASQLDTQSSLEYDSLSDEDDLPGPSEGKRHVPMSMVTFKELDVESAELGLLEYLNTEETRDDPWNHSVPVLDTVAHDDRVVVMMLRLQPFNSPPFQNVAECLDLMRQLLEGLAFFHEHKITRLNFSPDNIGMDTGLLPVTAPNWDRSEYHVQYHLIDLSGAIRFQGGDAPKGQLGAAGWMTEQMQELEELSDNEPADMKALGSSLQTIVREMPEMDFLSPFLEAMTASCPAARPTAHEALAGLDKISAELPPEKIFERFSTA